MQSVSTPVQVSVPAARTAERDLPMRAILQSGYGSVDVLRLGITRRPVPGVGEVLVQVGAAGIDRGTWHMMTGRPYLMRLMGFGFSAPKNPVAGLDLAGTVVEVGPQVTRFAPGDVVFGIGQGSFAEYARAREDKLTRAPQGFSLEQAAVLAVSGGTALQALDAAKLKAGERVLVIGASGGVGSYAVQLASALGAQVTGVCSTAKLDFVRSLGAAHVIDYRAQDFADGARKYDVVLDIGGGTPISRLRRCMSETGRLVFVGNELGGDWTAGFGRQLYATLLGAFVKQRFVTLMAREHFSYFERLAAFCAAGQLRSAIDRSVALSEVPVALAELEAGRVSGKIAVVVRALATLLALVALPACGTRLTSIEAQVDGHVVEVVETGAGDTTVVFESGLGNDWTPWDAVASEVATEARVFAYSRPGYGQSDPSDAPRDAATIVAELRSLLAARGVAPPYLLVGHSFGGTYMELFAKAHPEEVVGLVLVETRHRDFGVRCEQEGFDGCTIPDAALADLPAVQAAEFKAFARSADEIRAWGAFGSYPVRVLTATKHDGFSPQVEALWKSLHASLAREAAHGAQTVFAGAGHYLQLERSDDVARAILKLIPKSKAAAVTRAPEGT